MKDELAGGGDMGALLTNEEHEESFPNRLEEVANCPNPTFQQYD